MKFFLMIGALIALSVQQLAASYGSGGISGHDFFNETYQDGSEIRLVAPISVLPSGGFFPVLAIVENKGSQELKVDIDTSSNVSMYRYFRRSSMDGEISSSFSLVCPAGETRKVELLVPVHQRLTDSEYSDQSVDFSVLRSGGERQRWGSFSNQSGSEYRVGVSQKVRAFLETLLVAEQSKSSSPKRRRTSRAMAKFSQNGGLSIPGLPTDWRAYSGYDALVMMDTELASLPASVTSAIDLWIQNGGQLVVLGEKASFELEGFGSKRFLSVNNSTLLNNLWSGDLFLQPQWKVARDEYSSYQWELGTELGQRSLQTNLILLALVIFAIIVGPVNLFVWAKKDRRHRLFVTTPIISVITSVLLVGIIMLIDGFGGDGVRATAIDIGGPDDNTASIYQEQFSRTGILFSSGFEIDDQSVINSVPAPVSDFNRADSKGSQGMISAKMNRTKEGWSVSGDYFESRSEQAQVVRSVIPSRERLELLPSESGAPKLVSSFSYPLRDVFYRDGSGEIWTASEIASGETVTLSKSSSNAVFAKFEPSISRFVRSQSAKLNRLAERPYSFIALSDQAPSLSTHTSIDWEDSPIIITGLLSR